MDFITEDAPPKIQIFRQMFELLRWIRFTGAWIEVNNPRFQLSDEMQNFYIFSVSKRANRLAAVAIYYSTYLLFERWKI